MMSDITVPQGHSREYVEYRWDTEPNIHMLFLMDALMSNIQIVSQNLPLPTTEEERKVHTLHDIIINHIGQNMSLEQYKRWWIEVWISRSVDALQVYLEEILNRIYTPKTKTLKASGNDKSIQKYAEKQVDRLEKGLLQIVTHLNTHFGIGFDTEDSDFKAAVEIVEVRNIIVHHRSRVSKQFLQRLQNKVRGLKVGDLYPLEVKYALDANSHLLRFVETLDELIVKHFNLDPSIGPRLTKLRTSV